jgi:Uma2 family endonuclease
MNEAFVAPRRPATQAADGLPRWRWTVDEIERMAAEGYFQENDRFELLGGEIVPMSPKGRRHEIIRIKLSFRFSKLAPSDVIVASEPQFNLSAETFTNSDILVHPEAIDTPDVKGSDALLLVEVADTSLRYDLKTKLPLYAAHGVREYWVINAATGMKDVHRQPSGNGYDFVEEIRSDARLIPSLVPVLGVSLDALSDR